MCLSGRKMGDGREPEALDEGDLTMVGWGVETLYD